MVELVLTIKEPLRATESTTEIRHRKLKRIKRCFRYLIATNRTQRQAVNTVPQFNTILLLNSTA